MTARGIEVLRAGPGMTVQDRGRFGLIGAGLTPGGAADRLSLLEGHALVGNAADAAAIEMAAMGGAFLLHRPARLALTGAEMRATLNGDPLPFRASVTAEAGSVIEIGAATGGVYGYLHLGGGILSNVTLGGRGFHGIGGLGARLRDGDLLPVGDDPTPDATPMTLPPRATKEGAIRVMAGPQTDSFAEATRAAFEETTFVRSPRGNRQGVRFDHDGAAFSAGGQLSLVSDFIREGDIQMTGDGTPFVLLADCQTMGGYPRIGTVLPADLPRIAQMPPGAEVRFRFVTLESAEASFEDDATVLAGLRKALLPMKRDPREIANLLDYDLIAKPIEGD